MKLKLIKHKKCAQLFISICFFAFYFLSFQTPVESNEDALQNQEDASSPLQFAATLYQLGEIAERDGKLDQAEASYHGAFEVREKVLGPDHFLVGQTAAKLSSVYLARKNFVEGTEYSTRALRILEKNLGPNDPIIVKLKQDLLLLQLSPEKNAPTSILSTTVKPPVPLEPYVARTLKIIIRDGSVSKEIELKENEVLPPDVVLEKIYLPVEKNSLLLELKPKEKWTAFFNNLIDLPPELMESEDDARAWVEGTSSNDFCSIFNLDHVAFPESERWVNTIHASAKTLLDSESNHPLPILYCAARTFANVAKKEDIPYLKDLLNNAQQDLFVRLEAARGLFRILGEKEFAVYRETLKSASIETRLAATLVWAQKTEHLRDEEIISIVKEALFMKEKSKQFLRVKASELLLKTSNQETIPLLEKALSDEIPAVRMRALQILFLKQSEANASRLTVYLLSQDKKSYERMRGLQILAGAVSSPKTLYDALEGEYLVKMKIIGLMRKELLDTHDDLETSRTFVALTDIFNKPEKQQLTWTKCLSATAIWEQGGVGPIVRLYKDLEHLDGRYHDWDFALCLGRLGIGLLMDFFEERWNKLIQEPDKEPWMLLFHNEALARVLHAPFEKDRKRAEGIVMKVLESNDPWLQLLAARALLIAHLEMEAGRKKAAQEFLFYYHDKVDFEEYGNFAVGRLTLEPTLKPVEQGLEIRLNQSVVWHVQGVFFGGYVLENTKIAVGENGEALIQSIVLLNPKGDEFSPAAPLKEGTVLFSVKEDPLKHSGWTLRVKCVYKTLGQEAQEQVLEFPLESLKNSES